MTKKLVTIPEGNLLRIAAMKSIATLSDLKEKTGVDRKTLRTINTGRPVKEETLQKIADKLRIPLAHFLGPSTLDEVENSRRTPDHLVDDNGIHFREIKLQQLDAAALRRFAGETDQIIWLLKMDQMSESLEATLLQLRESLRGWFHHLLVDFGGPDAPDNLVQQISFIKASAEIDKSVEQLAAQNLKMHGGVYVHWHKQFEAREVESDYQAEVVPTLIYTSRTKVVLSIAPEEKNNSTVRVATGSEPPQEFSTEELPQEFIESELADIETVEIDGRPVWRR